MSIAAFGLLAPPACSSAPFSVLSPEACSPGARRRPPLQLILIATPALAAWRLLA